MDSSRRPKLLRIIATAMCFPVIKRSGSDAMANTVTVCGIKQQINKKEIIKTILPIFSWRLQISLFEETRLSLCHFDLIFRLIIRITVQVMMKIKARSGKTKLLNIKQIVSTSWRLSAEIIPRSVLFREGMNAMPSLLTT